MLGVFDAVHQWVAQVHVGRSQVNLGTQYFSAIRIFTGLQAEEKEALGNDSRAVLKYMILDKENPNSVLNIITQARENARSVQEHITKDLWQCLNEYYHAVRDPALGTGGCSSGGRDRRACRSW